MAIHLIAAKLLEQSGGPTNGRTQQPPDIAISRAMLLALLKINCQAFVPETFGL